MTMKRANLIVFVVSVIGAGLALFLASQIQMVPWFVLCMLLFFGFFGIALCSLAARFGSPK